MKANAKYKFKAVRPILSILLLLISAAYVLYSPKLYEGGLNGDPYRAWLMHSKEPTVGVIKVWHIVDFKPYVGSLGSLIEKRAKAYSSRFIGIHFEVSSYSEKEASELMENGAMPDLISFSGEAFNREKLLPLDGSNGSNALPFCASGQVILYDPAAFSEDEAAVMKAKSGSAEQFKKGSVPSCITDIRGAGDMYRAQLVGKAPYFEVVPYDEGEFSIQYIGITDNIEASKLPYARGLIDHLLSERSQKELSGIGLLPICELSGVRFDPEWLGALYELFLDELQPDCAG